MTAADEQVRTPDTTGTADAREATARVPAEAPDRVQAPVAAQQPDEAHAPRRSPLAGLRRHALTTFAVLLVSGGAAWAVTALTPPTYESQAVVQLRAQTDNQTVSASEAASLAANEVATYAALATTQSVLDPAIRTSGVAIDAVDLAEQVQVTQVPLTNLITIDVEADGARDAAELASAVATTLVERAAADSTAGGQSLLSGAVVTDPVVPDEPSSPRLLLNLAVGLAVGLAVAGAVVAVRESPALGRASAR